MYCETTRVPAAIEATGVNKSYFVYDVASDRLKQFFLPKLYKLLGISSKKYYREFSVLQNITFEVMKGETVGIIGSNGAGKSTLLQILCGTLSPTSGRIKIDGRVAALLELGSGFNPNFTGRENIYMNASILGLTDQEIDSRFDDIVSFAEIGDYLNQPVKTYSSGMYVRLAFSVIINVDADILVIDEALSVGDAFFQAKCMTKIDSIIKKGVTVLFVSHDISAVKSLCSRTLWIDKGKIKAFGITADVARLYNQHWISQINKQNNLNTKSDDGELEILDPKLEIIRRKRELNYSMRSGNGQAKYISFECFCESERINIQPLQFGNQLSLFCQVEFFDSCQDVVFSFHIKDKNNQHLVGLNTGYINDLYDRVWQPGNMVEVKYNLPVKLQAGRYSVTLVLSSAADKIHYSDVKFMDWVEDVCVFEVAPRTPFPLSDSVELEHEIDYSIN